MGDMGHFAQTQGQVFCQFFDWPLTFSLNIAMLLEGEPFSKLLLSFLHVFPIHDGMLKGPVLGGPCAGIHSCCVHEYNGRVVYCHSVGGQLPGLHPG